MSKSIVFNVLHSCLHDERVFENVFYVSDVFNHVLCSSTSVTMLYLYVCVVFLRCCYTILIYGFVIWCVYVLYVMCFLSFLCLLLCCVSLPVKNKDRKTRWHVCRIYVEYNRVCTLLLPPLAPPGARPLAPPSPGRLCRSDHIVLEVFP